MNDSLWSVEPFACARCQELTALKKTRPDVAETKTAKNANPVTLSRLTFGRKRPNGRQPQHQQQVVQPTRLCRLTPSQPGRGEPKSAGIGGQLWSRLAASWCSVSFAPALVPLPVFIVSCMGRPPVGAHFLPGNAVELTPKSTVTVCCHCCCPCSRVSFPGTCKILQRP